MRPSPSTSPYVLSQPDTLEREGDLPGALAQSPNAALVSAMPGMEFADEQKRAATSRPVAQAQNPLGGLPIGHARVGQARGRQHRRVDFGPDLLVRRVRADAPERLGIADGIAPFQPLGRGQQKLL